MPTRARTWFIYALAASLLAATVWAISFETLPKADFTFVNETEVKSVDPHVTTGQPEGRIIMALFEGLVRWSPATLDSLPGVAERWTISNDGLIYRFHLRDDARWSDGGTIEASDFVYSFRRVLDPTTLAEYAGLLDHLKNAKKYRTGELHAGDAVEVELNESVAGARAFARGAVLRGQLIATAMQKKVKTYVVRIDGLDRHFAAGPDPQFEKNEPFESCKQVLLDFAKVGVRAIDKRTLEVTLEHPAPYFLSLCGYYPFYPVQARCVETFGHEWVQVDKIVSNGAYRLQMRRLRDRIRLVASDTYWNRRHVALKTIDALAVESPTTALNLYLTGKCDWITKPPDMLVPELIRQQRKDFNPEPEFSTYFYRFNVTRGPLRDRRVRQALALAIDKQQIVSSVTQGGEVIARSFVPPGIAGYPAAKAKDFDPDEARRLLASAGFPAGRGFPKLTILYNTLETHEAIAQLIQFQWKKHLGIAVRLENQEWGSYLASQRQLQYDVCRAGWGGDYLDPSTFLDLFTTGNANNQTGYSNARYDQLIAQAVGEPDASARNALLFEAETLLLDEAPIIPLHFKVCKHLVRSGVGGFHNNLLDMHPLDALTLEVDAKLPMAAKE